MVGRTDAPFRDGRTRCPAHRSRLQCAVSLPTSRARVTDSRRPRAQRTSCRPTPSVGRAGTGLPSGPSPRRPQSGPGRAARDGVEQEPAAAAGAHDAVPAPAAVQPQAVDRGGPDERPVIGRVLVLAGLEEPVHAALPDVGPERRDVGDARPATPDRGAGTRSRPTSGRSRPGRLGAVSRSVSRTYAPRRAGRQCAPVVLVDRHRCVLRNLRRVGRRRPSGAGSGRSGRRCRRGPPSGRGTGRSRGRRAAPRSRRHASRRRRSGRRRPAARRPAGRGRTSPPPHRPAARRPARRTPRSA